MLCQQLMEILCLCIMNYAHVMLNYVVMIDLCPLTYGMCFTNIGCSASEVVYSKLASVTENGYLDLFLS